MVGTSRLVSMANIKTLGTVPGGAWIVRMAKIIGTEFARKSTYQSFVLWSAPRIVSMGNIKTLGTVLGGARIVRTAKITGTHEQFHS